MTNKQLNDYVTMKNISNISDQKKKEHSFMTFMHIQNAQKRSQIIGKNANRQ